MTFDDFSDQVEACLMQQNGWSDIQVADFISPRTRRLIQAYKDGDSVAATVATLMAAQAGQQFWGQFYSANDLAKQLLPGGDFDTANAFAVSHVSAAIENLAEWKFLKFNESGFQVAGEREAPFFGSPSLEP